MSVTPLYQQIARNKRRSWVVVAGFFVFTVLVGYVIIRAMGMSTGAAGVALMLAGFSSGVGYFFSDKMVLSLSGARPADKTQNFDFYTVTENLCLAARLPMPDLYVIDNTALNAFATGRDPKHAVVCATTGLLSRLDRTELEGVVAHELSHIRNYDIRLMSLVAIMVGFIALLADIFLRWSYWGRRERDREADNRIGAIFLLVGIILALLSPLIARLIKLAISRQREFLADASGAKLTNYPEGLARALEKIARDTEPLEAANKATAHLYIANPLANHHDGVSWLAGLFATHPPVAERIKRLRSM